jgi:hypothetical protein
MDDALNLAMQDGPMLCGISLPGDAISKVFENS